MKIFIKNNYYSVFLVCIKRKISRILPSFLKLMATTLTTCLWRKVKWKRRKKPSQLSLLTKKETLTLILRDTQLRIAILCICLYVLFSESRFNEAWTKESLLTGLDTLENNAIALCFVSESLLFMAFITSVLSRRFAD